MSRDDGFRIADVDVGILDDPKWRALVRSTRDEALIARCVVAYLATVTSSWGRGERMTLEDSAPMWLTALEDLGERLVDAGLLDVERRIPAKPWAAWFGPAVARREKRRSAGRKGGLSSGASRAEASLEHRSTNGGPMLNPAGRQAGLSVIPTSPSRKPASRETEIGADRV